jgi:uracil-DNA glycosylase
MASEIRIEASWKQLLKETFESLEWKKLSDFVKQEYTQNTVYPQPKDIFKAFDLCPFQTVKVVILGQDPYHGAGQAHGLSFSVREGVRMPPSLQNIYKELQSDMGVKVPTTGTLEHWARQGVLLLNATLTVRAKQPGSHQKKGWEEFTDTVVRKLNDEKEHVVFILWGNYAKKKGEFIDRGKHLVLEAAHPSPYSAHSGFFGCKHFSKANAYLIAHHAKPIEW